MYDDQLERPPWLRNLQTKEEIEASKTADTIAATQAEPTAETPTKYSESSPSRSGFNRRHLLLLTFLLWMNVLVLGCLCLLGTQRVIP
jgi:hypothetical protein